ncbi:MAG: extracellular solute-binding protein [Bacilli bacterium]|nr:extracellular solute-binding protein [Bacilli bacterium]
MKCKKKILIILMLMVFAAFMVNSSIVYAFDEKEEEETNLSDIKTDLTYVEYLQFNQAIFPNKSIDIDVVNYDINSINVGISNAGVYTTETSLVNWPFIVEEEGYYNLKINYYPTEGNGLSIQRKLLIDGEYPFTEAKLLSFYRLWHDENKIQNENGNEIRPSQVEIPDWIDYCVSDETKFNEGYFQFYLTEGEHLLTLESVREPMEISSISFVPVKRIKTYQEKLEEWTKKGYQSASSVEFTKYQAEAEAIKSSPSLYATSDNTSSLTENHLGEKNHLYKIRLNLAGGNNWKIAGDFIEWKINVPEEGLYQLSFRYIQDLKKDLPAVRILYINGEIPFVECENIEFEYTKKFQIKTLGDNDGWYFHFKKGENTIRLQVGLGRYAQAINEIKNIIDSLNKLYRDIIVITGSSPDPNVDYQLKAYIPNIEGRFINARKEIEKTIELITNSISKKTEETVALNKLVDQLNEFSENVYKVSTNLSLFSSNISSLGTCLNNLMSQPLKIDYFGFHSEEAKLPKGKDNFFQKLWFEIKKLVVSFFVDYDSLGSGTSGEENITVWVLSGRDQAQVIKNLVSNDFTPEKNIGVSLKVVPSSALLPNTLIGEGPDVVLMAGNDLPVQYAFRNATYDLSTFSDFEEVIENNYYESALTNLRYNGGVYGLPETISFPVMFYREDIIVDQFNFDIPDTWDELLLIMLELQNYNMDIYLGQPSNVTNTGVDPLFASKLYQNGGDFYFENGKETALREENAIQTFIQWTEFYTQYGIPLSANFVNRFRSGDMPIGISDYSLFNTLTMSAPEINGKWKMALLPGTTQEDGSIDRSTLSSGTACMMIKNTEQPDASWEFLKWWTSDEVQTQYGREIESILGVSARYLTANIESMKRMPWSSDEIKVIREQYSFVKGFEQVPGGYITARELNYAFRKVVNENTNPRETLLKYSIAINSELTIKRKEFGLE